MVIGLKPTPRLTRAAESLLDRSGLPKPREITRLHGGANNRVYRVRTPDGRLLLKQYFCVPSESGDRLAVDYQFCAFARAMGLEQVPAVVSRDEREGLALYEYVDGRPLRRGEIGEAELNEALEFVRELNLFRGDPIARRMGPARDARFSVSSHMSRVGFQVAGLRRLVEDPPPDSAPSAAIEALGEISLDVSKKWNAIRRATACECDRLNLDLDSILELDRRILSPCDFGFHNALRDRSGRIRFLDFEFSGWDDPARLIGDFFNRPSLPVPGRFLEQFQDGLFRDFANPQFEIARSRILQPLFRFEWSCVELVMLLSNADSRHSSRYPASDGLEQVHRLDRAIRIMKTLGSYALQ